MQQDQLKGPVASLLATQLGGRIATPLIAAVVSEPTADCPRAMLEGWKAELHTWSSYTNYFVMIPTVAGFACAWCALGTGGS